MTHEEKTKLVEAYVESIFDSMDYDSLCEYATQKLYDEHIELDDAKLLAYIEEDAPHLLVR
jgi:hypothetical protein